MATRIIEAGFDELLRQGAARFSRYGRALVNQARQNAPVRRGYRSFDRSAGPVGGTLRDAITYATAVEGRLVDTPGDQNGASAPGWLASELQGRKDTVELLVYTNTAESVNRVSGSQHDYGLWVHEGTSRMPARPFLSEALDEVDAKAELSR